MRQRQRGDDDVQRLRALLRKLQAAYWAGGVKRQLVEVYIGYADRSQPLMAKLGAYCTVFQ